MTKKGKIILSIIIAILLFIFIYDSFLAPSKQIDFKKEKDLQIKVDILPELKSKIQNLENGANFWAKVEKIDIENNTLNLSALWYDPLYKKTKSFPVTLTLSSQDEIIKYVMKNNKLKSTKLELKQIKTGDLIIVLVKDNKKMITLITPEL